MDKAKDMWQNKAVPAAMKLGDQLKAKWGDLTQKELMELGFWNDFQRGFGSVMGPATQIASSVGQAMGPNSEYGQMANQFAQMSGAINNGVQNTQFDNQLQELGFWNDFGKGFKIGFGAVAKPASFIPGVGSIMGAANNAVQMIPGKLQNLESMRPSPARYGICKVLHEKCLKIMQNSDWKAYKNIQTCMTMHNGQSCYH